MKSKKQHRLIALFRVSIISFTLVAIVGELGIWGTIEFSQFEARAQKLRDDHYSRMKQEVKEQTLNAYEYLIFKKNQAQDRLKKAIRSRTLEAHKTATHIYNKYRNTKTKAEIADIIHDALFAASWDNGQGYYFADTMDGIVMIHRNNPELEGTNITDPPDSRNARVFKQIAKIAKEHGEGYCSYRWNMPGKSATPIAKYSYVKYFKPLDWAIGSGKYLKDEEEQIQNEILERFSKPIVGDKGYIFAGTYEGISLTYPNRGISILSSSDINGKPFVKEIIQAAKNGGDFVQYVMPRIGREQRGAKISYTMGVDDWQWYIGYGKYLDEIDSDIESQQDILLEKFYSSILWALIFSVILILIAIVLLNMVTKRVSTSLEAMTRFFDKAAYKSVQVPEDEMFFSEFAAIATAANSMVDQRDHMTQKHKTLQNELQRAQKMEALGLMAGGVAHDLNNILTGLVNIPELILQQLDKDDPTHEMIQLMHEAGTRASLIVKDLLTVGRGIASNKMVCSINLIIEEFLKSPEHLEQKAQHPNIKITTDLSDQPVLIECSVVHITKSLVNLVVNAMESMEADGHLDIKTSVKKVTDHISGYQVIPNGEYILLEVSDNGEGIDAVDIERIFEPFYSKKIMGRSGTGLGLAIVWNTMKDHNGYIDVVSSKAGTCFQLFFPKTRKDKTIETSHTKKLPLGQHQSILIIDDEKIQRKTVSKMATSLGYVVKSVASGEEAILALKAKPADIIILDMTLGAGMSGLETYKKILTLWPNQKAIIATGHAKHSDVAATQKLGARGCLHKPYKLMDLATILAEELSDK